MQRERSRERLERARRQWELENADTVNMNHSNNSLPRHNNIPSYEATVLHMVITPPTLCIVRLFYHEVFKMSNAQSECPESECQLDKSLCSRMEPQAQKQLLEFQ